jgi:hypothetical protein
MRNKLFTTFLLVSLIGNVFGQDVHLKIIHQHSDVFPNKPEFNNDVQVLACDLHNLLAISEMNFTDYYRLMKKYEYDISMPTDAPDLYIQQTTLSVYNAISILKRPGKVVFIWTLDDEDIARFKDELHPYFHKVEGNKSLFALVKNNIKYNIFLDANRVEMYLVNNQ